MHSDLQGLLPAKAVIDNVEPEARSQPKAGFQTPTSALQRLLLAEHKP